MTDQVKKLEAQLESLELNPDSLITHKIDALNQLAWIQRYSVLTYSLGLSKTAYDLAKSLEFTSESYPNGHLASLRNLAYFQGLIGDFDQSFSYSTEALSIFDNIPTLTTYQKELQAGILSNMGMVSAFMGYYPEAVDYLYQAINLATEVNYAWAHAQAVNHLGFIHTQSGKHQQAIESMSEGVKLMQKASDQGGEALCLNNLAWSYTVAGEYDNGLKNALKSMNLVNNLDVPYLKSTVFDTIGSLYLKMGDLVQGRSFLEQAVAGTKITKYKFGEVTALINLGKVLYLQEDLTALDTLQEAIIVGEYLGAKYEISQCHLYISKIHEQQGQLKEALHHYKQYNTLQQEIFNSEADKKVKYLEVLHATETAKKEVEIYQLQNVALEHEINEQLQQKVNEKTEIESALRESEERHRLISELISDFAYVYAVDEDDKFTLEWVTSGSFSRLTGFSWSELGTRNLETLYQLYHPDDKPRLRQDINLTLQGKTTIGVYRIFTKENNLRWVQIIRHPVWDKDEQRVTRMNCVVQDITERKLVEIQLVENASILKRQNQELQNFTHISSHDLQEPLRKIQIFSERLQEKHQEDLDERGQHYLARIHNAAARCRLLIQDLLDYSQLSNDAQPMAMVDLDDVVGQVLDDLAIRVEETAASIIIKKLPTLEANQNMMYQLFLNLIVNALKFRSTEQTPVIEISSNSILEGISFEILIKDNGIGFDEKYAERIFSIFQRLHNHSEFTGTGIGLTICRQIVEQHQGQITASSEVGVGTQFRLILPLKQP